MDFSFCRGLVEHGFSLFATDDTFKYLELNKVPCSLVHKMHENKEPNVLTLLKNNGLDLVVLVADPFKQITSDPKYDVRRAAIDYNVPLITNLQIAKAFAKAITKKKLESLEIKAWEEYL